MNKLIVKSPAKINLYLKILNKFTDGYHEIDTAFQLIDLFDEILNKLPENVLNDRITTMKNLTFSARSIEVPSIYIQASSDKVVPRDKFNEFKAHFNNIELVEVEGPHFILQNKPEECANAIIKHVSS